MSVEAIWNDAAYFAALVEYLIEHKTDNETDAEIADQLQRQPWLSWILLGVLTANETNHTSNASLPASR